MAKISPNDPCPCESGLKYKRCCRRWHDGAPAPTAEALMRSRYTAYAVGNAEYIIATTHPDGPHWQVDRAPWLEEIGRFCRAMTFEGLTIRESRDSGDHGMVDFVARLRQGDRDATLVERSRFIRSEGRWLYHSGLTPAGPPASDVASGPGRS